MKFIISILLFFIFTSGNSQELPYAEKDNIIQWVGQFPKAPGAINKAKSGWFARLVFGKKRIPQIIKPVAILKTSPDYYLVLDQGSNLIFKTNNDDKKIPKAFKKSKINFASLVGFCKVSNNEVLFTDSRKNKIFRFNENQKELTVFNKNIELQRPTGIAYSLVSKNIWVVETGAHRIVVLNEQGELIKTIGRRGNASGEFNFPTSIWIDKTDKVYVVDAMNFRIQVFNAQGEMLSTFGEAGNATGYFARPKGIATDSYGNIYITDALFHTVQIFDISGKFLYQFGEQGTGKGQFWMPSGIYIDDENYIYVADSYNSRIQIFKFVKGN